MSRFRFRVWDTKDKEYLDPNYYEVFCLLPDGNPHVGMTIYNGICDEYQVIPPKQLIVEQCTGFEDKNGKLIYEGDVVRVEDDYGICNPEESIDTGVGNVEWVCGMWYIAGQVNLGLYETKQSNYIEIIGNIHDMEVKDEQ